MPAPMFVPVVRPDTPTICAAHFVDNRGWPTVRYPYNPNGSVLGIEGIISPDGKILGKMGHSERYARGLFKNIGEGLSQPIFAGAVKYFRKQDKTTNNQ